MPVGFYNNWDNILVKLQDILRDEFGASLAVYTGLKNIHEGNQYLQISPTGSELLNYVEGREERWSNLTERVEFLAAYYNQGEK